MNEDAIRALVRDTLARLDAPPAPSPRPLPFVPSPGSHASFHRYSGLPPSDGPCFIEPGVACNHCGYCQTHGH